MDKKEFDISLKIAGFTKKKFAEYFGLNSRSVNNWGVSQNIPYWVESWLNNYIELQELKSHSKKESTNEAKKWTKNEIVEIVKEAIDANN